MTTAPTPPPSLRTLGWDDRRAAAMEGDADAVDLLPARITAEGAASIAATRDGEREVVTQRAAARARRSGLDRPTIGDWLAVESLPASPGRVALRTVMPRRGRGIRHSLRLAAAAGQFLADRRRL